MTFLEARWSLQLKAEERVGAPTRAAAAAAKEALGSTIADAKRFGGGI